MRGEVRFIGSLFVGSGVPYWVNEFERQDVKKIVITMMRSILPL